MKATFEMPNDIEAEKAVLSACLLHDGAAAEAARRLSAEDYYRVGHAFIHDAISSLVAQGAAVDHVTLANRLSARGQLEKIGGRMYLVGLCDNTYALVAWPDHMRLVKELATQRRICEAALKVAHEACKPQESFETFLTWSADLLEGSGLQRPASESSFAIGYETEARFRIEHTLVPFGLVDEAAAKDDEAVAAATQAVESFFKLENAINYDLLDEMVASAVNGSVRAPRQDLLRASA